MNDIYTTELLGLGAALTELAVKVWYKASEVMDVLGVKETRTKELLRALIAEEKVIDDGETKGKRYKKLIK